MLLMFFSYICWLISKSNYIFTYFYFRNQNEIDRETFDQVKLFVLAGTHDKFTEDEFKFMKVNSKGVSSIPKETNWRPQNSTTGICRWRWLNDASVR